MYKWSCEARHGNKNSSNHAEGIILARRLTDDDTSPNMKLGPSPTELLHGWAQGTRPRANAVVRWSDLQTCLMAFWVML
jgi:hypothetical protein